MRIVDFIIIRLVCLIITSSLILHANDALANHKWYLNGHLKTYYDNKFSEDEATIYYGAKVGYQIASNMSSFIEVGSSPVAGTMLSLGLQGNIALNNDWSFLYAISGSTVKEYENESGNRNSIMPVVGQGVRYAVGKGFYIDAMQDSILNSSFSELKGANISLGVSYYFGSNKANTYTDKLEREYGYQTLVSDNVATELDFKIVGATRELQAFELDRFELNESSLTPQQIVILTRELKGVSKNAKIKLTGYTDDLGSEVYNLGLGLQRAQRVKFKLIELGYHDDNINVLSYGVEHPISTNHNNNGRSLNRRVNVVVCN
ncbi:OmpA family protein [Photobacterium leiognathi]|uniref:OmpA family protein n=1 Tax=Photobacterium leiognathi TaxID=553611 RepID=UPI0027399FA9|nr:OmpA family protein [Photobacterium leiognathi]